MANSYKEYKNISKNQNERIVDFMNANKYTEKDLINIAKKKIEIDKIGKRRYKFTLYIVPEGKASPRSSRFGKSFYVPNIGKFYKLFKKLMKENRHFNMISTPCAIECHYYLPIPKTMNKEEKILAEKGYIKYARKPDYDNLAKMNDFMNGILLLDDALIYEAHIYKHYSFKPRIEIEIKFMKEYDSKFTEKSIKNSKLYQKQNSSKTIRKINVKRLNDY